MGIKNLVKQALIKKENRNYLRRLRQKQVTYPDWAAQQEAVWTKQDICSGEKYAEQRLIQPEKPAEGSRVAKDFVVICASAGALSKNALNDIECYFNEHPEVQILYGDEDVWPEYSRSMGEQKERRLPWFKPDWSPDLMDGCLYFGSITALRKGLYHKVQAGLEQMPQDVRKKLSKALYEGNREGVDYEVGDLAAYELWLHNCLSLAGAYEKGSNVVGHIPWILFHGADENQQILFYEVTPSREGGDVAREFQVSVIIPSRDHPEVLEKCLQGCRLAGGIQCEDGTENLQFQRRLSLEVLLVDNGSSQDNREQVESMVRELEEPTFRIRYLYRPMEFNFSAMCNLGAQEARGQFLLFLNDDVQLCLPGCIDTLAALAGRSFTGAVGMKLYYPDSIRIQHAGITNLPMGPVHKLQFLCDNMCYYYGLNRGRRNVLAVTAACLMVEKEKFLEAGGFAEGLRVAFNDVDLCFRLHELGYWNVCVNDKYAYHHESLSRGDDESPEKLSRLLEERDRLYSRHPQLEGVDPFYSIHLNREELDTRVRPAYVTAGNELQKVRGPLETFNPTDSRQDPCLLVRIEDCRDKRVQGYGVVLGDNNACYDKCLLFRLQSPSEEPEDSENPNLEDNKIYLVKLSGQYRPELEENMPDQVNVALSGFLVELEEASLPAGRYQLGLAARNRVTGLRLLNWSNRYYVVEK